MELVQNTEAWLKWRHEGIGASDTAVIMGASKYKDINTLYEEKIKKEPPVNEDKFIFKKGHKLEDIARKNLELETFEQFKPLLIEYESNKKIKCSLDGYNENTKTIWECKYMGKELFNNLKNENLTLMERIPPQYYPQLMHQALITNPDRIALTGIIDNKVDDTLGENETSQFTLFFELDSDHLKYISEMKVLIEKLIVCIEKKEKPKKEDFKISPDVFVSSQDKELKKLLTKYKACIKKEKKISEQKEELKNAIFEKSLTIHNRVECKGFKITESVSKTTVGADTAKYLKHNDLTPKKTMELGYKKFGGGTKSKRITLPK